MTGHETHQEVPPCDRAECEKLSVVELTWGEKSVFPDENRCNVDNLCRKHADARMEEVNEDSRLEYDYYAHPEQIRYAHKRVVEMQNELISEELKKEKANIRVPEGTDPLNIIDFDEIETDVVIAGTYDHQIVLTLCESEEHAKKMDSEHLYEQKRDRISIAKCWSGARGGPSVEGGLSNQDECDKTDQQRGYLDAKYAPEEFLPSDKINNTDIKGDTDSVEDWF